MYEEILMQIESILYMAKSSVNIIDIAKFFNKEKEEILDYILKLQNLREKTGINILINDNYVSLSTNAKYGEILNDFFNIEIKNRKLSKSNMEVLALIAYKGKLTKSEISNIRGQNSDHSVNVLLEKKLIYSKERKNSVGKPKLYELSSDFYKYLGLESKEELLDIINIEEKDENEDK